MAVSFTDSGKASFLLRAKSKDYSVSRGLVDSARRRPDIFPAHRAYLMISGRPILRRGVPRKDAGRQVCAMALHGKEKQSGFTGGRVLTPRGFLLMLGLIAATAMAAAIVREQQSAASSPQQQALEPDVRFDNQVRDDMFTGMAGSAEALDRAMKLCEDRLARNPKHPEALVWHGSGVYFLGGRAFQQGQVDKGIELTARGLKEMDDGVALLPDSITVLIPRAATLLEASKHVPYPAQARPMLEKALGDYEKIYAIQKRDLAQAPIHARGELFSALAEGCYRAGNVAKAREYMQLIVNQLKDSAYAARAKKVLDDPTPPGQLEWRCIGCHVESK